MALRRGQRASWSLAALMSLGLAVFIVFGIATSASSAGQDSALARKYTTVPTGGAEMAEPALFDDSWGGDGEATTLVLYDSEGPREATQDAETQAIVAANLATHFGMVQTMPIAQYMPGVMNTYDGVVYLGTIPAQTVPSSFRQDMMDGDIPILWAGANISDVSTNVGDTGFEQFREKYGWDPGASTESGPGEVNGIEYKDQILTRNGAAAGPILIPDITDEKLVEVLGTTMEDPQVPWATRSGNLTYIGENPLTYVDETDRYLAFADLFYDLLDSEATPTKQAAVRLEDVDAAADPGDLRAIADYLFEHGIPFQVAVVPIRISASPEEGSDAWIGLSLADRPDVVSALKYMQERGGTLLQHGTTHQYATLENPYSGDSGADFEFYRSECSATAGPAVETESCQQDSYVVGTGPIGPDTVDGWVERLEEGRAVFAEAGLGDVTIFETPHYLASPNAYAAMAKVFDTRYERSHYYPGQLSGQPVSERAGDQFFPYRVHDIYGADVLPENLGNITEEEQNNHPVRDPATLISNARANLVVRESTASFFYHPFLGVDQLRQTVEGIQALGFTFVAASELR